MWLSDTDDAILGYFTLCPAYFLESDQSNQGVPGILLAKLALSVEMRGQDPKAGPLLLLAALSVVSEATDLTGGKLLAVDAPKDGPYRFYLGAGFEHIEGSEPRRLVMRIKDIKKALV